MCFAHWHYLLRHYFMSHKRELGADGLQSQTSFFSRQMDHVTVLKYVFVLNRKARLYSLALANDSL